MTALSLEERAKRRIDEASKDTFNLDKPLANFLKEILGEMERDTPDNEFASGMKAAKLLKFMPKDGGLAFAERVLHNTMFRTWIDADAEDKDVESTIARALLARSSFFGISPAVAQWKEAVKAAMRECSDSEKLERFLALADEKSNELLVQKASSRLAELAPVELKLFVAKYMSVLGTEPKTLHVIEKECLLFAEASMRMAKQLLSRDLCFTRGGLVYDETRRMLGLTFAEVSWTSSYTQSNPEDLLSYKKWLKDAKRVAEIWREKHDNPKLAFNLVLNLYPYGTNWLARARAGELEPMERLVEKVG